MTNILVIVAPLARFAPRAVQPSPFCRNPKPRKAIMEYGTVQIVYDERRCLVITYKSVIASEAKQSPGTERGDCFVGKKRLLAMTG